PQPCSSVETVTKRYPNSTASAIHTRTSGAESENALDCRRQAAYCRIELGDLTEALAELRGALVGYRNRGEERCPTLLEMRRTIAHLQITLGKSDQARDTLPTLYRDITAELGAADSLAGEVRDMLTRTRAEDPPEQPQPDR